MFIIIIRIFSVLRPECSTFSYSPRGQPQTSSASLNKS